MAFSDALKDVVTIYSITTGFKAGDTIGEEAKTSAALYTNVPCKLISRENSLSFRRARNKEEDFTYTWILQMEASYNAANRGDKAVINGDTYIIEKKQEIKGTVAAAHHVVYYLEEAK